MNPEPLHFNRDVSLEEAVQRMAESGSSYIVIVEDQKPCGIITERDVTQAFASMLSDPERNTPSLADTMTMNPVCIGNTVPYDEALTLSRSRNLRHFPVVDELGKLIGVVSQANLLDGVTSYLNEHERLENSLEEFKLLSLEDALLKIGNRRAMEVDLNYTEAEAQRHDKSYALALLDIDFFKRYNDHYGHQEGDNALREVADTIKKTIRESDRVYRYGGEEILVLMPETGPEQAHHSSERIRQAIEALAIPHADSPFNILTLSGGCRAQHQGTWKEMISQADKALYQAKSDGRNRIVAI